MDVSVIIRFSVIFHVISLLPKQRSYGGFVQQAHSQHGRYTPVNIVCARAKFPPKQTTTARMNARATQKKNGKQRVRRDH